MDPYLGEISIFAFNFAPRGWALCNGALLPVQQNQALFALLGKYYGGDGVKTFGLPDLQGRTPVDLNARDANYSTLGVKGGSETVSLTPQNMPQHTHGVQATTNTGVRQVGTPSSQTVFASTTSPSSTPNLYVAASAGSVTPLNSATCSISGAGQAHENMQPSLVVNFAIATMGYYPPRD